MYVNVKMVTLPKNAKTKLIPIAKGATPSSTWEMTKHAVLTYVPARTEPLLRQGASITISLNALVVTLVLWQKVLIVFQLHDK